jgi:hypothetical protein
VSAQLAKLNLPPADIQAAAIVEGAGGRNQRAGRRIRSVGDRALSSPAGFDVRVPDYGLITAAETRIVNPLIVRTLPPYVEAGDVCVGHSNGCAIGYDPSLKAPLERARRDGAGCPQTGDYDSSVYPASR